jgi:glycerol kinase
MQMQSDFAGVRVVRPAETETTALGAAFLAGLGTGVWASTDEVAALWRVDRSFEPRTTASQREARFHAWRRAVERVKDWAVEA